MKNEQTSKEVASIASSILRSKRYSAKSKSVDVSALAQAPDRKKQKSRRK